MKIFRSLLPILLVFVGSCAATAPPTEYRVNLTAPQTQMVDLSIVVPNVSSPTVEFILPTWRPGRYVILDPASTLRDIRAYDDDADALLPIRQTRKNAWLVTTSGASTVRVDYRIYANSLGDRTRHVDDTHAFLSPSSVFLYVPDRRTTPLNVTVNAPDNWNVATGLEPLADDPFVRTAPNYDVLVDSPLEIGLHETIEFENDGARYEIVLWGQCEYDRDELVEDFSAIIDQHVAIFGSYPYSRYVFITHVGRGGGGTEHLNSTVMQTSRASLEESGPYKRFLGLVSHEFFHTWNVKQLRPAGIHPYDYEKENYTPLLWVAEGSTSYYAPLTLTRADLKKPDDYLNSLAGSIESHRNRPARHMQTLEQASFNAWNQFGRSTPDDVNSVISFYSEGALASLLLDLTIRKRTGNAVSYDTVMRAMYERYPLTGPGYTTQNMIDTINDLTGNDFTEFFDHYVRGTFDMHFEDVFDVVGLELTFEPAKNDDEDDDDDADEADEVDTDSDSTSPLKAYLGLNLGGSRISSVRADGPAYPLGFVRGDEIIAIDDQRIGSQADLDKYLKSCEPDQSITITFFRRDRLETFEVTLAGVPDGKWKLARIDEPTDAQKAAYQSWLGRPWPGDNDEEADKGLADADDDPRTGETPADD